MPEYVDRVTEAVAEAIYMVDAARYGNGIFPWTEISRAERNIILEKAKAAIRCYCELKNLIGPLEA